MGRAARHAGGGKALAAHVVELFGLAIQTVVNDHGQIVDDRLENATAVREFSDQST